MKETKKQLQFQGKEVKREKSNQPKGFLVIYTDYARERTPSSSVKDRLVAKARLKSSSPALWILQFFSDNFFNDVFLERAKFIFSTREKWRLRTAGLL